MHTCLQTKGHPARNAREMIRKESVTIEHTREFEKDQQALHTANTHTSHTLEFFTLKVSGADQGADP